MSRIIKAFLLSFIALISTLFILATLAFLLINPNNFKPEIAALIKKNTGQTINLEGKLKLQFYPALGISVQNIQLKNPQNFSNPNFAVIQKATFKIQLRPLVHGKVHLNAIQIDGLTLNLEQTREKKVNWKTQPQETESTSPITNANKQKINLQIYDVIVNDSTISYLDATSNKTFTIANLNLKSHPTGRSHTYVLDGSFTYKDPNTFSSNNKFNGELKWANESQKISLSNLVFSSHAQVKNIPNPIKISLNSNLVGNLQKNLFELNNVNLKLDDTTLTGKILINAQQDLNAQIDLMTDNVNLNPYLQNKNAESKQIKSKNIKKTMPSSPTSTKINGNITVNHLTIQNLSLHDIRIKLNNKNNQLNLNPLSAKLYSGTFTGMSSIYPEHTPLKLALQGTLSNIKTEALLNDLTGTAYLSGNGNISTNITQNANGLNGKTQITITKGSLDKIDLDYFLSLAQVALKKLDAPAKNYKKTDYESLTATIEAINNVLHINNLLIEAKNFTGHGSGTINLNTQSINYKISIQPKDNGDNALPLAIKVYGKLNNPQIQPDIEAYVKVLLERKLKDKIDQKINKSLGQESTSKNPLDKKINDEIKKNINKFFKF